MNTKVISIEWETAEELANNIQIKLDELNRIVIVTITGIHPYSDGTKHYAIITHLV